MNSNGLDGDVAQQSQITVAWKSVVWVVSQLVIGVSQQVFDGLDGCIGEGTFVDV